MILNIYGTQTVLKEQSQASAVRFRLQFCNCTPATHKLLICTGFTLLIAQVVRLAARMMNLSVRCVFGRFFFFIFSNCISSPKSDVERTESAARVWMKHTGHFVMHWVAPLRSGIKKEALILTIPHARLPGPMLIYILGMVGWHSNKFPSCNPESLCFFSD